MALTHEAVPPTPIVFAISDMFGNGSSTFPGPGPDGLLAYDPAAAEGVAVVGAVPAQYTRIEIYALIVNFAGGAGNVVMMAVDTMNGFAPVGPLVTEPVPAAAGLAAVTMSPAGGYELVTDPVGEMGRIVTIGVARIGMDAGDTYASDLGLAKIIIAPRP